MRCPFQVNDSSIYIYMYIRYSDMETPSWVIFVCNIHISTEYTQFMYVDKKQNRYDEL